MKRRVPIVTYRGVVYPWQCDSMGHMTTRYYMAMFDDASLHLLFEMGFRNSFIGEQRIGWADVRHAIEYHCELRAGDLVQIQSKPTALGNRSIEYCHEMMHMETQLLHARMIVKTVQFDLSSRRAIQVLAQVRQTANDWLASADC